MTLKLKSFGRSSAIYLIGDLLAKGSRFLLIPVYVRFLTQEDMGVLALLQSIIAVLSLLFSFALGSGASRFYVEYENEREADRYVAALWWAGMLLSGLICGILVLGIVAGGATFFEGVSPYYLVLSVGAAWLGSSFNIPLARFVVREEPVKHRLFSLLQFGTTTVVVIYLVIGKKMGVEGVLLGQVATYLLWSGIAAFLVTYPAGVSGEWGRLLESVRYSLPIVPHRLFEWGLSLSDRIILEWFIPLAALGIYSVGYQLGAILLIVGTSMNKAWLPQFFRSAGRTGGATDYGRIATYFMGIIFGVALALVLFAPEMIAIIAPTYDGAILILQVVACGYVFHALYLVFSGPLFYMNQTKWIPIVTGAAVTCNVATILVLAPFLGAVGGAVGTVTGYVTMAAAAYFVSRRFYPVAYETRRIATAAGATLLFGITLVFIPSTVSWLFVLLKLGVLVSYALLLTFIPGFLSRKERGVLLEKTRFAFSLVGRPFMTKRA